MPKLKYQDKVLKEFELGRGMPSGTEQGDSQKLTHSGTYWVGRQIQKIPWLGERLSGNSACRKKR